MGGIYMYMEYTYIYIYIYIYIQSAWLCYGSGCAGSSCAGSHGFIINTELQNPANDAFSLLPLAPINTRSTHLLYSFQSHFGSLKAVVFNVGAVSQLAGRLGGGVEWSL